MSPRRGRRPKASRSALPCAPRPLKRRMGRQRGKDTTVREPLASAGVVKKSRGAAARALLRRPAWDAHGYQAVGMSPPGMATKNSRGSAALIPLHDAEGGYLRRSSRERVVV